MRFLLSDIQYAARGLRKNPGFAAISVVTLALGIGANTAIFSVVDAVLLRPLPFTRPESLVAVWSTDERSPQSRQYVSSLDLADLRDQAKTLENPTGWFIYEFNLVGGGDPTRIKGAGIDGNLFTLLGEPLLIGRGFSPGEDHVVVLSHALWERRFNADAGIVGRTIVLNNESYTVLGVMPRGFQFPLQAEPVDLWATWDFRKYDTGPSNRRDARTLEVWGRLTPRATPVEAQAELDVLTASLAEQYPETNKGIRASVVPAVDNLSGGHRRGILVLFGAVGCVLLIACVNVANLLLARATKRRREVAVRAALGASRARLRLQLLIESLLLAMAGGAFGCLIAVWGVEALVALNPGYMPGAERVGVDLRVLGFTFFISLLTGLIFGLAPAWHASKVDLTTALKEGGRASVDGVRSKLRSALVVAEVSLALILLAGAALLINSLWRLRQVDPGLDPHNVLTLRVSLPYETYDTGKSAEFYRRLQSLLQALPGVRAASTVLPLPLSGDPAFDNILESFDTRLDIEGRPLPRSERPRIDGRTVQPDYFKTLGIAMPQGRDFSDRDDEKAPLVAIVNESLARLYFPGEDVIGKQIRLDSVFTKEGSPFRRVVGVVGDVRHRGLDSEAWPEVYVPLAQDPFQEMFVVVKTEGDPAGVVRAVRAAVLSLDPEQPIYDVKTFEQRLGLTLAQQRFNAMLLAIFSGLALLLAIVGLYGVMSYLVAQRTQEIGIRMALGAKAEDVARLVFGHGMKLVIAGVVSGLAGAVLLTRLMESLLFGVSATDPLTLGVVVLVLVFVALLACYLPARRAMRVDPMVALRYE